MPNYADPNTDFGLEQELLIKALKQAQTQQDTRLPNDGSLVSLGQGGIGFRVGSGPGGQIAAGLDRIVGNITKPQVEQNMRDWRGEETRRYDELTRQMNEPQTIDYSNPEELTADNTRRMGIAAQMSKLPMAQKMAETYLSKGANFPEAIAKMRMDQIERGQQAAQRAVEKDEAALRHEQMLQAIAAGRNQTQITIAGMPARSSGGGGDDGGLGGAATNIGADEQGNAIYRHHKSNTLFQFDEHGQPKPYTGKVGAKPMADKPLTEAQGNAMLYGTRAAQAHNVIDEVGVNYSPIKLDIARGAENVPGGFAAANTFLLNPTEQKADQAQRNFINAILRKESGAAINQSEFDNARRQYFPQQGDSPQVLAQKRANRELAIKGLGTMGGPKGEAAVRAEQANKPDANGFRILSVREK
jgi:hypothetical protein